METRLWLFDRTEILTLGLLWFEHLTPWDQVRSVKSKKSDLMLIFSISSEFGFTFAAEIMKSVVLFVFIYLNLSIVLIRIFILADCSIENVFENLSFFSL
jgi:hypothetical protein